MSKIRVSILAEKLGIDTRETLARLKEIGVEAKSSASLVEEDAVKKLLTPQPKESSTSTEAIMLSASRTSSANAGSGTSMTNTSVTAATGMTHSAAPPLNGGFGLLVVVAMS